MNTNKLKIFNDPIYGFIHISDESIFDIIEHPYFQRLRRINQLGLTYLVYPGATHTRFQHSMGAMHLMKSALQNLKDKGVRISDEEMIAAQQAILLHDVGHGPFSHTLELNLLWNSSHEDVGKILLQQINRDLGGVLDMALAIIENKYPKNFLHQLVSSQLDMDRLDYLKRDSYFTGVSEGVIGTSRLIKMLNVHDDKIVVEAKGIYSVEKFLVARRIMYWQVYLHKTVLGAEQMLIEIIKRARQLASSNKEICSSKALNHFLSNHVDYNDLTDPHLLELFTRMDDHDILFAIKEWCHHDDTTLSILSRQLVNRELLKVVIQKDDFNQNLISDLKKKTAQLYQINLEDAGHFVFSGIASNRAYNQKADKIFIIDKGMNLIDIATASDNFNIQSLSAPVKKNFLCFPKKLEQISLF
jgi:HD superfamily phosphohydrolase